MQNTVLRHQWGRVSMKEMLFFVCKDCKRSYHEHPFQTVETVKGPSSAGIHPS